MNTATGALSALRRIGTVLSIAIVFVFGLATTVYLSLRSPEVKVPDVVGKDRFEAERVLGQVGLNFRIRATRPSSQMNADTVLFQLPRGGDVVKVGQTVAMDISRSVKAGETSEVAAPEKTPEKPANQNTNEAASANENKSRRNKNTNKNANDNANARTGNQNTTTSANKNTAGNTNRTTNLNSNRPAANANTNANRRPNQNGNVSPAAVKPSPLPKPTRENR